MPRRWTRGADEGHSVPEYLGLAVLIAAIIASLVAVPSWSSLAESFRSAICRIMGSRCPAAHPTLAQRTNEYYEPQRCLVSRSKSLHGVEASAIVTIGGDMAFVKEVMSDGSVKLTALNSAHASVEVGVGADVSFGKVASLGSEVAAGVELEGGYGKTWVFDSRQKASKWIDNIKKNHRINTAKMSSLTRPFAAIYDSLDDSEYKSPRIIRYRGKLQLFGRADAGGGLGFFAHRRNSRLGKTDKRNREDPDRIAARQAKTNGRPGPASEETESAYLNPEVGVHAEVQGSEEVRVAVNRKTGETTTTIRLTGKYKAAGEFFGRNELGPIPLKAAGTWRGALKVTKTKAGVIKKVEVVRATRFNDRMTVRTTSVEVDSPNERAAVVGFLRKGLTPRGAAGIAFNAPDLTPTARPGLDARPIERFLYREAKVASTTYKLDKDNTQWGLEGKLGIKVGLGYYGLGSNRKIISARYLGAPTQGKRNYVDYTACIQ